MRLQYGSFAQLWRKAKNGEMACILWRNMRNALQLLVGLDLAGDRTLALLLAIDCD